MKKFAILAIVTGAAILNGCSRMPGPVTTVKAYPVVNLDGIIARDAGVLDASVSSDGNGSLKIVADKPMTVRLYETGDVDVENARLTYRAKLRTSEFQGKAYLEMWCCLDGMGEFFSRDMQTPVTGNVEWTTEETPFFLQEGQNPDNIKLNVVIEGTGTIWIDDIRLLSSPLKQ